MNKQELVSDIKRFMISELKLKIGEDAINDDAPIFGSRGLGVDSLDGIQIGVSAEARYNVRIPLDTDEGKQALSSINNLADYVMKYGFSGS